MKYPILKLLPKRDKSVLNRHPWIFSGGVQNKVAAEDGDIVEVRNHEGIVLGYGFFSSTSQIVCRMFDWGSAPAAFDQQSYWKAKFENALALRQAAVINEGTNAYRLIHAEGDFLPGLIVDVYGALAVAQILIAGTEKIKNFLFDALRNMNFSHIYVKAKTNLQNADSFQTDSGWIEGQLENPVLVKENGLNFMVDFIGGQKTGFFLDQRDNRQLLGKYTHDKIVLNAFSYTGGFSVYALARGAKEVHSLDISNEAVEMTEKNVKLNAVGGIHHKIVRDCFDYLKEMPDAYFDTIVLDPPAFAKHARAVENAAKGYKQINLRAIQKIKPGGVLLTFSCSQNISKDLFQKIVFGAAADAKRNVRILEQLHQPADHPINIFHPEGEYLKGLAIWVE